MRYRLATVLAVCTAATISCGVPGSSKFTAIDKKNIPFGLSETTAVPTTSTTIALASTTTVVQPATTIATETVLLFFIAGTQLRPVTQLLPSPASLAQTMSVLETGPQGELGIGASYRNTRTLTERDQSSGRRRDRRPTDNLLQCNGATRPTIGHRADRRHTHQPTRCRPSHIHSRRCADQRASRWRRTNAAGTGVGERRLRPVTE